MSDLSTAFQRVAAKWQEIGDLGVICPPGHFTVWHEDDQWCVSQLVSTLASGAPSHVIARLLAFEAMKEAQARKALTYLTHRTLSALENLHIPNLGT